MTAAGPHLTVEYINHRSESVQYRMGQDEGKALADLLSMYAPRGPIRKIITYFGSTGGMPLYVGHSEYYDLDYLLQRMTGLSSLTTGLGQTLFAGGKGAELSHMFISSLSETVERVFGSLAAFSSNIVYGTHSNMLQRGFPCLGPDDLPLFADEQYAAGQLIYERFTEKSFLGWIEGRRLISGEPVWMPAQLVLLFYPHRPDEDLIGYSTSGGLASHINEKEAILHGVMELIERDAVNLRWVSKMVPEVIQIDREPRLHALSKLLAAARGVPGDIRFYLHSTDILEVPVVTVKQFCPWLKRWGYYAGGGVSFDTETAMFQALTEFGQAERTLRLAAVAPARMLASGIRSMFDITEDASVSQIDIFFKISAFYGYPANARKMDWYVNGNRPVPLSSLPRDPSVTTAQRYERLLAILVRHHIDPIVFDFTPPQFHQVRLTKVYIPELTPPYIHSKPLFGHPRYYAMPSKLGFASSPLSFSSLSTDPMPYP